MLVADPGNAPSHPPIYTPRTSRNRGNTIQKYVSVNVSSVNVSPPNLHPGRTSVNTTYQWMSFEADMSQKCLSPTNFHPKTKLQEGNLSSNCNNLFIARCAICWGLVWIHNNSPISPNWGAVRNRGNTSIYHLLVNVFAKVHYRTFSFSLNLCLSRVLLYETWMIPRV